MNDKVQMLREILQADITRFPSMENKVIEVCNRIAGEHGEPCNPPDPVMFLEMMWEINEAGLSDAGIKL